MNMEMAKILNTLSKTLCKKKDKMLAGVLNIFSSGSGYSYRFVFSVI